MRNLLAFIGLVIVVFLGAGWYLDWYKVSSSRTTEGHQNVSFDINSKKIGEDIEKGKNKIIDNAENKINEVKEKSSLEQANTGAGGISGQIGQNGPSFQIGGPNGTSIQFPKTGR